MMQNYIEQRILLEIRNINPNDKELLKLKAVSIANLVGYHFETTVDSKDIYKQMKKIVAEISPK
jgi:hypothetical protein